MRYYALEKLIDLYDGYRKIFKIDEHNLLLLQEDGKRYLIESRCPHRGQLLAGADISGPTITCPHHGYRFDVRDGRTLQITEEPCRNLRVYELVDEGREVGVVL